eukprot:scaffold265340_cov30-Tisochrysis_lutea.AAC.8
METRICEGHTSHSGRLSAVDQREGEQSASRDMKCADTIRRASSLRTWMSPATRCVHRRHRAEFADKHVAHRREIGAAHSDVVAAIVVRCGGEVWRNRVDLRWEVWIVKGHPTDSGREDGAQVRDPTEASRTTSALRDTSSAHTRTSAVPRNSPEYGVSHAICRQGKAGGGGPRSAPPGTPLDAPARAATSPRAAACRHTLLAERKVAGVAAAQWLGSKISKVHAMRMCGEKLSPQTTSEVPPWYVESGGTTSSTRGGESVSTRSMGMAPSERVARSSVSERRVEPILALRGVAQETAVSLMKVAGETPDRSKTHANLGVGARLEPRTMT